MKLKSKFALLDSLTKKQSDALAKRLKKEGPIPVRIEGYISDVWGGYDGTSQEFMVTVVGAELSDPVTPGVSSPMLSLDPRKGAGLVVLNEDASEKTK